MKGTARRRPKASFNPPPPPTPQFRRDSDVSFASSRPSSIGMSRPSSASIDMYKERAVQISTVNTINSSLKELFSHSFNVTFKPFSPPSLKDLTETINLLLQCLDYPPTKLEDDLPILLKSLGYPFKINKNILKNPPAPHQWYQILALLHWLVQVALYNYNLANDSNPIFTGHDVNIYVLNSYLHYMRGDDDSVEALDQEFMERLKKTRDDSRESLKELEEEVKVLEAKVEALRCSTESKKMVEDVQQEAHNLDLVEGEAEESLKNAKLAHQEAIKQGEEEIHMCARELLSCLDSVSQYKAVVSCKISDMESCLSKAAAGISEAFKNSMPAE
uniref:Kinetochore protein NDC80 n=1 Tax=Cucumis sativus TaxID=3659 RepID=A0A0A0L740_CUCSA